MLFGNKFRRFISLTHGLQLCLINVDSSIQTRQLHISRLQKHQCRAYNPIPTKMDNDISGPSSCQASGSAARMSSAAPLAVSLDDWSFAEPQLAKKLPLDDDVSAADALTQPVTPRRNIAGAVFSLARPTPLKTPPKLVAFSEDVLRNILDMDPEITKSEDFVNWVTGNTILEGSIPMSHRYGGHQFGYWAEQLGDGRAHLLGEYVNRKGERWELQLKGSGKTPYSRFGDGRAVLRSSVREFLCSEAMHYLGVPTSRAASLTVTKDGVVRDMFYDGRMKHEPAAVVLRLAPTWFRFGSFEILARNREHKELHQLADFVLEHSYPHLLRAHRTEAGEVDRDSALVAMFAEVVEKTADLVSRWNAVGFAHGVLNTDNMSILGITIDYGPFGFLDSYDPTFTPNHSDDDGRYDYQSQVNICLWNLDKLGQALKPLLPSDRHKELEMILRGYGSLYQEFNLKLFREKLGLQTKEDGDDDLVNLLLETMEITQADFTQTFRDLSELSLTDLKEAGANTKQVDSSYWGLATCFKSKKIREFIEKYVDRVLTEHKQILKTKTETDLLSSDDEFLELEKLDSERIDKMQGTNPRYILRNWIAQRAIEMAEQDDFSEVQFLLKILKNPFRVNPDAESRGYAKPPPDWARSLAVSCSS